MLSVPASVTSGNKLDSMISLLEYYMDTRTDNKDAEKFSAYSLNTLPGKYKSEEIFLYGVEPDSKYIHADLSGDGVYISSAYADKFRIKEGDTITLKEKYESDEYSFKVDGIYEYTAGLCVFMERSNLNEIFDLGDDYFGGYFSNTEIKDIKEKYIGSVVRSGISYKDIQAAGCFHGRYDGNDVRICCDHFSGCDLSSFQGHHRKKCPVDFHNQDPWLYRWRDQQTLYPVYIPCGCVLSALSLPIERQVMEVLFREMMLSSISCWLPCWWIR